SYLYYANPQLVIQPHSRFFCFVPPSRLILIFKCKSGCDPALLGIITGISSWMRALPNDATIYLSAAAD
ncbi:hypothetical protein M2R29_20790, partial [Aeromonas hydrophila]|uniref:hypothetical protein n=1 Tax=Aeromonas hydrophila TaxID=644 RepID=UPI00207D1221